MVLGGIPRFVKGLKRMEVVLGSGEAGMKNGSGLGVDWGNNVTRQISNSFLTMSSSIPFSPESARKHRRGLLWS